MSQVKFILHDLSKRYIFVLAEHEEIKEEFCTALSSLTNLSAVLAEMVVDVTQSEP